MNFNHYGLGSRIRDVKAFSYKSEIFYIIGRYCMVYPQPKFLIFKTKKTSSFFYLRPETDFFGPIRLQDFCNKFIKINCFLGFMVWQWLGLFKHWTFVKYWREKLCFTNFGRHIGILHIFELVQMFPIKTKLTCKIIKRKLVFL